MSAGISNRLGDERATRAVLAEHDRRLRRAENEDVIIGDGRRLILRSPNGHFWNVTVSNAGVLSATDMGTSL
jgi:hypothetical protein